MKRNEIFRCYVFFACVVISVAMLASCNAGGNKLLLETYISAMDAYEKNDLDDSQQLLNKCLKLDSSFAPAHVLLGKIVFMKDDPKTAALHFRKALKKQPSFIDARIWLVRSLRLQGEKAEADGLLDSILADDPFNASALRLKAGMASELGDIAGAARYLERAVSGLSESATVFIDRANLLWIAGKKELALQDLRTAQMLLPDGSMLKVSARELEARIVSNDTEDKQ